MSNRAKSVIFTILTVSLIAVMFVVSQQSQGDKSEQAKQKEIELIGQDYQQQVKKVIADYQDIVSTNQITTDNIAKTKQQLLALKVPTKFKDFHLDLVLALTKIENSFTSGNQALADEGRLIIDQTLANNDWLY